MGSALFFDPQAAIPADFCPVCGSERYAPGLHCIRCERRGSHDHGGDQRGIPCFRRAAARTAKAAAAEKERSP